MASFVTSHLLEAMARAAAERESSPMTESEWMSGDDPLRMLQRVTGRGPLACPACGGVRTDAWPREGCASCGGTGDLTPAFRLSERKLRLYAVALSRALGGHDIRKPLILAEHAATMGRAEAWADTGVRGEVAHTDCLWHAMDGHAAEGAEKMLASALRYSSDRTERSAEAAAVLRCLAGSPFRPLARRGGPCGKCKGYGCGACVPWLTPDVLSLARGAYEERLAGGTLDPFRLCLLSDALEYAGCPEQTEHRESVAGRTCPRCGGAARWRSGGPHFENERICHGCWLSWEPGEVVRYTVGVPHPLLAHLRSPGPHYRGCHPVDLILGRG